MEYIRYVNFPKVPSSILDKLPKDLDAYEYILNNNVYKNTKTNNESIIEFCSKNICEGLEWRQQFITGDFYKHIDIGITHKFLYVYDTGGDNVITKFWDNSHKILLKEYCIPVNQWMIMKVDAVHSVDGIEQNRIRKAIVGWIF